MLFFKSFRTKFPLQISNNCSHKWRARRVSIDYRDALVRQRVRTSIAQYAFGEQYAAETMPPFLRTVMQASPSTHSCPSRRQFFIAGQGSTWSGGSSSRWRRSGRCSCRGPIDLKRMCAVIIA
jgi:hypothetical protein